MDLTNSLRATCYTHYDVDTAFIIKGLKGFYLVKKTAISFFK